MSAHKLRSRFFDACWETELRRVLENVGAHEAALNAWRDSIIEATWFRKALTDVRVGLAAQNGSLRYVWVFKPFGAIPGEAMIGRSDADLLPGKIARQLTAFKRGVLDRRQGARGTFTVPSGGGELVIEVRSEPVLNAAGNAVGLLSAAIDLTAEAGEQRRLVESRRKAEAALLATNQAIARAAHDLRQPFQAMHMLHQVLEQEPLGDRARLIVAKLGEAMRSGEALLSGLLEYSVMDSRLQLVRLEDFPLQELLDTLHIEASAMAMGKGIDCRVVRTSAVVTSDRALLGRLLRNLLVNAVRYTRRGKVLLGVRRRGPDEIEVQVWDTGIGIPDGQQALIFEDFYRTDEGAGLAAGLGLGLAGVSRISEILAHPVRVWSKSGLGSMFAVRVPISMDGPFHGQMGH